ncbi:MAG: hypothetical protein HY291_23425 [Planctomycetes bacterium]|nr:hypothetical protein [Planctomycetota bacterium]
MIRLSANLSRKLPIAGVEYSSQQYGAALEIEVSDQDKPEAIQAQIRELYALLNRSIDEQITAATKANGNGHEPGNGGGNGHGEDMPTARRTNGRAAQPRAPYRRNGNGNGNGNGNRQDAGDNNRRPTGATQAQQRAIFAICKEQGLNMSDVLADYGAAEARDLSVMDASKLIDALKGQQSNRR